jgi:hypothetical protein
MHCELTEGEVCERGASEAAIDCVVEKTVTTFLCSHLVVKPPLEATVLLVCNLMHLMMQTGMQDCAITATIASIVHLIFLLINDFNGLLLISLPL